MIPENRRDVVWSGRGNSYLSIPVADRNDPLTLVLEMEPADFVKEKSRQRIHIYMRDKFIEEIVVDRKGSYRVDIPEVEDEILDLRLHFQDAYRPYDFEKSQRDYYARAVGLDSFTLVRR